MTRLDRHLRRWDNFHLERKYAELRKFCGRLETELDRAQRQVKELDKLLEWEELDKHLEWEDIWETTK